MEGTIRVNAQVLINTSNEFATLGDRVSTLTQQMTELVNSLSNVHMGEDADAYRAKFSGLNDDIQKMIAKVKEHSTDLNDMAQGFIVADNEIDTVIGGLPTDVII